MAAGQIGRTHVRAYRFAVRQREWALTQIDPLIRSDPGQLPRRWTLVSFLLAAVLLTGFGVFGMLTPAPEWREATLLLDTGSGTLYVNRNGVVHPTLNLASALLAIGAVPAEGTERPTPKQVSASDLADAPRGALMGIPGAPDQLPAATALAVPLWGVCDLTGDADPAAGVVSTVVIGDVVAGDELTLDQALLVVVAGSADTYLVWNGHRSRIDPTNAVINQALRLGAATPRTLSAGLLAAIPEATPIVVPEVDGAGLPTSGFSVTPTRTGGPLAVGAVFQVNRVGSVSYHVVHRDGVEQISATLADLLRFRLSVTADLPTVTPQILAATPVARQQLVSSDALPSVAPVVSGDSSQVCAGWDGRSDTQRWRVTVGQDAAADRPAVALAGTDPRAHAGQVQIRPGSGAIVEEWVPGQLDPGAVYLVTDVGVAYPIASVQALRLLGFSEPVALAPKQVLDLLPRGPLLDPARASTLWDSFDIAAGLGASATASAPPWAPR